ncbi:hypothetical protein [Aquimarina intermedia]|uniref:DUF1351 domain-containing protein n=1 Tax=Aquimarina intermedia TaxID=350814 RepID=A0A5S5BWF8_9FLAO|nr:hypothetical protein [Aquimarina intermedia]TYP71521.1 hypothetical protein BD809_109103 [Aquimarina intermedia]
MKNSATKTTLDLALLDPNKLPELQGWKDKQKKIVKENPFITIEDNKTYEEGKKRRTALVSARTSIQNQDKEIAKKIKQFRSNCIEVSNKLIAITLPHEEKQQEEVRRYEAEKEAERAEKARIEQVRKESLQKEINDFYDFHKNAIINMTFETIEKVHASFLEDAETKQETDFEEFELDLIEKINLLNSQHADRSKFLTEKEDQRKEDERLEAEKEKLRIEREKFEAEQKAKNEAAEKKQKEQQAKLDAENAKLEAEKKKLADEKRAQEEAKQKAQEEAERKAKEDEARKRAEALKPDKEKLVRFINSLQFAEQPPKLDNESSVEFLKELINDIDLLKDRANEEASKI